MSRLTSVFAISFRMPLFPVERSVSNYFNSDYRICVINIRISKQAFNILPFSNNEYYYQNYNMQEKVGKPSETDSIKYQISSKTSRGKKDSTKDTIKDITSDSQVNSYFPHRWSPASLTFNIYFNLFLIIYNKNNDK